jgi:hypothetical protein
VWLIRSMQEAQIARTAKATPSGKALPCLANAHGKQPDGQITCAIFRPLCPAPFKKIFGFAEIANHLISVGRPAPLEGRCATSRNAERDAVDAGCALDGRVLLADGEGVWS